jgi:phosphoserine phosphatase RsbU/P
MALEVTDLHLIRDQLLLRRKKLEEATAKTRAASLVQLLEKVDQALERVETGSFGVCEDCHGTVEAERLLADPLTRFCLGCLNPAEQRALEEDLALAARIQGGLLPGKELASAGWKVSYHYQPAGMVSGDYLDLVDMGRHLYFMVGDVSGKGVAAAMLMANLHAMFRALIPTGLPLEQLMARANRIFSENTLPTQYATLICGRADQEGTVEMCNGGHVSPLHVSDDGVKVIESCALPVGLFQDQEFTSTRMDMLPGDSLVLYTDGVSEAEDGQGVQYGETGLRTLLSKCCSLTSKELVDRCVQEVLAHRAGSPGLDDQTIMVLQFRPSGSLTRH